MKIAIVHDYLKEFGGAERVLDAFVEIWPEADIFTTVFLPEYAGPNKKKVKSWNVKTSLLQYVPFKGKLISMFRFVAPFVFWLWDFSDYDVVIVSKAGTYSTPNLIRKGKHTLHVCYCHTPPRYLYGYPVANRWDNSWIRKMLLVLGHIPMHFLRMIDYIGNQRPDYFIVNSKEVSRRVEKFYRRKSTIIYPPVEIPKLKRTRKKNYYLFGGRLSRSKRPDLAIKACRKLGIRLKVFGRVFGDHGKELKKYFLGDIDYLGEISDKKKWKLMSQARAFIFPSEFEDFGIMPVEAMSVGTPVIALGQGGVLETVVDGKTGVLFDNPKVEDLEKAIKRFETIKWDKKLLKSHAQKFSKERFKKEISEFIRNKIKSLKT